MKKIKDAFENGKAFIAFLTCGDPDLETTERLIKAIAQSGADLIELGIPFSDPTAEGPVIQSANLRALSGGVTTDKIFEMLSRIKAEVSKPMLIMTYANVVFSYGTERFMEKASACGVSGLILPDVPFEEKDEFARVCKSFNMEFVSLIAPTSKDRIAKIAGQAEGFVYCVSSLGVTGTRSFIQGDVQEMTQLVRRATKTPCAIGFGISTPDQAAQMAQYADGVIVGSAIVKLIGEHGRDAVPYVSEYVRSMKDAITRQK